MRKCEYCNFYNYDDELEEYVCDINLDEDEVAKFMANDTSECAYWRPSDDYKTSRKQ